LARRLGSTLELDCGFNANKARFHAGILAGAFPSVEGAFAALIGMQGLNAFLSMTTR
jgi:hypothetical protein